MEVNQKELVLSWRFLSNIHQERKHLVLLSTQTQFWGKRCLKKCWHPLRHADAILQNAPHTPRYPFTTVWFTGWMLYQSFSERTWWRWWNWCRYVLKMYKFSILSIFFQLAEDELLDECVSCGEYANIYCNDCKSSRCQVCDKQWHKHPKRSQHKRRVCNTTAKTDYTCTVTFHMCTTSHVATTSEE